jgi:hypothetical protein
MPSKECSVVDERLQFVARRLAGEPMADLCRGFGISRKTGYKIFDRFADTKLHFLRLRQHAISKTCDRGKHFASDWRVRG